MLAPTHSRPPGPPHPRWELSPLEATVPPQSPLQTTTQPPSPSLLPVNFPLGRPLRHDPARLSLAPAPRRARGGSLCVPTPPASPAEPRHRAGLHGGRRRSSELPSPLLQTFHRSAEPTILASVLPSHPHLQRHQPVSCLQQSWDLPAPGLGPGLLSAPSQTPFGPLS